MTRKDLAEQIYHHKIRTGACITPVGRKTPLSKQEFVHRYLNGVGASKGFKKAELQSILSRIEKVKSKEKK